MRNRFTKAPTRTYPALNAIVQMENARTASYTRALQEHLAKFVSEADAVTLAHRFAARADEGTVAYWPDLVALAVRLRADHAVAGLPVTEATCARHEQVLAEPLVIPVWGL